MKRGSTREKREAVVGVLLFDLLMGACVAAFGALCFIPELPRWLFILFAVSGALCAAPMAPALWALKKRFQEIDALEDNQTVTLCKEENIMVQKLTAAEFQEKVLDAKSPVLVDFYADWCVPCKMFAPVFEAVAEELGGEMIFGKLNIDENMEIAENYQVSHIPTLILFKDGKVLNRISQSLTKADLREFIRANIR